MSTERETLDPYKVIREGNLIRPLPPKGMFTLADALQPAPELEEWLRKVFINKDAPLFSLRHEHLREMTFGCFWSNAQVVRGGKRKAAAVEDPMIRAGTWGIQRHNHFLTAVFGFIPDFLLTVDVMVVRFYEDIEFLALCKHELCHMGQKVDAYDMPKLDRETGKPKPTIVGHDVEEFVDVVELFGAAAAGPEVVRLVAAANQPAYYTDKDIRAACGTCK